MHQGLVAAARELYGDHSDLPVVSVGIFIVIGTKSGSLGELEYVVPVG